MYNQNIGNDREHLGKPFHYINTICMSDIRNHIIRGFILEKRVFDIRDDSYIKTLLKQEIQELKGQGFLIFDDIMIEESLQELRDLLIKKDIQISRLSHNVSILQKKLNKFQ